VRQRDTRRSATRGAKASAWRRAVDLARFAFGICRFALDATRLIFGNGTLDTMTVNGDLDLTGASSANATIVNGLVLNGTAFLGNQINTTTWGYLSFAGSQALSGSGQVLLGRNACNSVRLATAATTLTNRVTIHGHSGQLGFAASCIGGSATVSLVNEGTIAADVTGGTITHRGQSLRNAGTIQALNGGNLSLENLEDAAGLSISGGGTLTLNGTWANTGALTANGSALTLNGTWANTGAINFTNSTLLNWCCRKIGRASCRERV